MIIRLPPRDMQQSNRQLLSPRLMLYNCIRHYILYSLTYKEYETIREEFNDRIGVVNAELFYLSESIFLNVAYIIRLYCRRKVVKCFEDVSHAYEKAFA